MGIQNSKPVTIQELNFEKQQSEKSRTNKYINPIRLEIRCGLRDIAKRLRKNSGKIHIDVEKYPDINFEEIINILKKEEEFRNIELNFILGFYNVGVSWCSNTDTKNNTDQCKPPSYDSPK